MKPFLIMVIDDEENMRKMIRKFLEKDGYDVIEAHDGTDALTKLTTEKPDLLIVDVMMPFMDGFTLAKEVKKFSTVPLIFLSAKGEEWDRVHGLKLGGDDYIVKPFMPEELLARIESVLRRTYQHEIDSHLLKIGPLAMNTLSYEAMLEGKALTLTPKEFHLLHLLAKNRGRVYAREQLLDLIWGEDYQGTVRTVDTHIKTLRIKMGYYGKMIATVWSVGYKFEV